MAFMDRVRGLVLVQDTTHTAAVQAGEVANSGLLLWTALTFSQIADTFEVRAVYAGLADIGSVGGWSATFAALGAVQGVLVALKWMHLTRGLHSIRLAVLALSVVLWSLVAGSFIAAQPMTIGLGFMLAFIGLLVAAIRGVMLHNGTHH